jgi:hypothetical protein
MKTNQEKPSFKIVVFTLLILLFPNFCFTQTYNWSIPQPITDSVSDNKNPVVITIGDNGFMFWEKSTDSLSTAIYMRNLTNMTEPVEILALNGVHFRNPQFIRFGGNPAPDTLFYLLYETDQNGNIDIHYLKYCQDGNFYGPEPAIISPNNDRHLRVDGGRLVWERNGNILYSHIEGSSGGPYSFAEPVIFDENECLNPVICPIAIAYEKSVNSNSKIYCSFYDLQNSTWLPPEELYTAGHNTSLSFIDIGIWGSVGTSLLWESLQDGQWEIYVYDFSLQELHDLDIQSSSQLYPNGLEVAIILKKQNDYLELSYLTFLKNENGNDDIFVNDQHSIFQFFNLSNSLFEDLNPRVVVGRYYWGTYYIYDIWESFRNGHWQFYMSETMLVVSIEEQNISEKGVNIKISPNPFRENLLISYLLKSECSVELSIYDHNGKHVTTLVNERKSAGKHDYIWDGKDNSNNIVSPGLYFIRFIANNSSVIEKAILLY